MNVKEFKTRWLRGYVNPELRKLPVRGKDDKSMIIKIKIDSVETEQNSMFAIGTGFYSLYSYSVGKYFYSYNDLEKEYNATNSIRTRSIELKGINLPLCWGLKDEQGQTVSPNNYPELFTDNINDINNTSNTINKFYLPCYNPNPPHCTIDWGDGTTESYNTNHWLTVTINNQTFQFARNKDLTMDNGISSLVHYYKKSGEYIIKITGEIPAIRFYNYVNKSYISCVDKILEIVQWGDLHLVDTSYMFYNYSSQRIEPIVFAQLNNKTFKNVILADYMFAYNKNISWKNLSQNLFSYIPNLLKCDYMYAYTSINYVPDKMLYNHNNLICCYQMFYGSPIEYIGDYAFANCVQLTRIAYLTSKNNKLKFIGNGIFENDIALVDVSYAFDGGKYGNYENNDSGLQTIGNNIFKNCISLRCAEELFEYCYTLVSVGENLFENCDNLIDVTYMFRNCYSLENVGEGLFKGCSKVRDMFGFFADDVYVNFPENFLYDLKTYDYLDKAGINFETTDFNSNEWYIYINYADNTKYSYGSIQHFLQFKGVTQDNYPIRYCGGKNLFNKEFVADLIRNNNDNIFGVPQAIFYNQLNIRWKENNINYNKYICNFTGSVFPLWEVLDEVRPENRNSGYIFNGFNGDLGREKYASHYDNIVELLSYDPIYTWQPEGVTYFVYGTRSSWHIVDRPMLYNESDILATDIPIVEVESYEEMQKLPYGN